MTTKDPSTESASARSVTTPTGADMFRPIAASRVSQDIVVQIKTQIRRGNLVPGDRLPSERDLCQQFGVSRVTVREALRILESGGMLDIRVGAHGGAFVRTPSAGQLGAGLADLLSLSPMTAAEVTEARLVFELGILPLVVERATEDDVAELLALVEEGKTALDTDTYTMSMSAAFHVRLASCTHNPAFVMIMESFHGPLLMSLREAKVAAPLMGRRGTQEHHDLALAIQTRDLPRAMQIMSEHIGRTAERVGVESANGKAATA